MPAKLKLPKLSPIKQQLQDVLPTMDVLDQFYDTMIRDGFGPLLRRRFKQGLLLANAGDVLALVERLDPTGPNDMLDHDSDGRRLKRYAVRNGSDPERFAAIAYCILVEWSRLTSLAKGGRHAT